MAVHAQPTRHDLPHTARGGIWTLAGSPARSDPHERNDIYRQVAQHLDIGHQMRQYSVAMTEITDPPATRMRVGQAAEMLGVSVETMRRWESEGRLTMARSEGGQRLVDIDQVAALLAERRKAATDRPIVAQSARNRFSGIVTRIEADRVAAVVEVMAGPHRLVSLMTAEAVEELGLRVGDEAVCVVKATNVIVEIPSPKESRS
ncbi:MAG TPA: TOBE domain-containing protein [Candidatus Limnocylindrales bacterium]